MKGKNLKLLIATSLVSGALTVNSVSASTDATPNNWKGSHEAGIVDHEGDGCGASGCGANGCGNSKPSEESEAPADDSGSDE